MPAGSLSSRKALFARLIAYDAIECSLSGCDQKQCTTARGFFDELRAKTNIEIVSPNDDVPLDQYIHMTIEQVADVICVHPQFKPDGGPLKSALSKMRTEIETFSCAACAGDELICSEGDHDERVVARSGHCVARFRELFTLAREIAEAYHNAVGITRAWPDCSFKLRFVNVKPHPFGSPIPIGGETDVRSLPVVLSLFVEPTAFDQRAYMCVPYVLVHEMFHVLGGSEGATRTGASRDDPFAEGWIDWIAFEAVRQTVRGTGPAANLAARFRYPTDQIHRAQTLHQSRGDDSTSENGPLSRDLRAGRIAAERFFDLCCRYIEPDSDAWTFFLAVSLRLNLKPMSTHEHRQLTWRVIERIPFRTDMETLAFLETAKNLRKYFISRDVDALINWLTSDS